MAVIRFNALQEVFLRKPIPVEPPSLLTSDYFGVNVFDKMKMEKYLTSEAFEQVMEAIEKGTSIDRRIADQVASGMKAWAIEMGAGIPPVSPLASCER